MRLIKQVVLFKGGVIDKRRTEIDSLHDVIGRGFSGWIYIHSRNSALSLYSHRDTE